MRAPALLAAVVLLGCSPNFPDAPDAPPRDAAPPPVDTPPPPPPDAEQQLTCRDLGPPNGSGHHFGYDTANPGGPNDGPGCLSGCHNGVNGPRWYAAGTLYVNYAGDAPLGGATVHVKDANGKIVEMISGANGNFWTSEKLVYPVKTWASACPTISPMEGFIVDNPANPDDAGGNCNLAGCHSRQDNFRVRIPQM